MAKWCGKIGYVETVEDETRPGNWIPKITERTYVGDIPKHYFRSTSASDGTNNNLNVDNHISVISDSFAETNFRHMRYIEFMGAKWNINSADVQRPRIILTIGGLYNGEQA